eukprot:8969979-Lingulodinium_polyedra.AAC.1
MDNVERVIQEPHCRIDVEFRCIRIPVADARFPRFTMLGGQAHLTGVVNVVTWHRVKARI